MAMRKLVIRIIAVAILASLTGIVLYQWTEISSLSRQNDALETSLLQANDHALSQRIQYEEEIEELSAAYSFLNSSYYQWLRLIGGAHIFLNKIVYSPGTEAFWKPDVFVPIEVTVVDSEIDSDHVTARVSSSLHTKKIVLERIDSGIFKGSVMAVGLRLGESISDTSHLSVRYGGLLIAEYDSLVLGSTFTTVALFEYPAHVTSVENTVDFEPWGLVDPEGVPLVNYGSSIGIQYNPTIICDYALTNYHMYVATGNFTFRLNFLTQAGWLVKNSVEKADFRVWEYRFDWPWGKYNATDPFVSALAQGEGLSVLTRAYILTGNETYLGIAEASMRSFGVETDLGGVRYSDVDGVWYEEIADIGACSGKVLNAFHECFVWPL